MHNIRPRFAPVEIYPRFSKNQKQDAKDLNGSGGVLDLGMVVIQENEIGDTRYLSGWVLMDKFN